MTGEHYCVVGECLGLARDGTDYCWVHRKRRRDGKPMHAPVRERLSLEGYVLEAVFDVADAGHLPLSHPQLRRALARLRYATARWHGISPEKLHGGRGRKAAAVAP